MTRTQTEEPREPTSTTPGVALVLLTDQLGQGSAELGRKLIHGFLRTTLDSEPRPWRIVLLNHGVRLATVDDMAVETLDLLTQAGTEVLSCGTCLEFLELKDRLRAGRGSNMFEILETLNTASKVVTIG